MIRVCAGSLAALVVSAWLATAPASSGGDPAPPAAAQAPRLVLEGTPRIGFRPLHVVLRATLSGVSRDDENFCHVDQVWVGQRASDPGRRQRASVRRPRCHHAAEQRQVDLRFYKDLTLTSPGMHTYRLVLEPKSGQRVESNPVTIQVLMKP